jgi:hypothetical protein
MLTKLVIPYRCLICSCNNELLITPYKTGYGFLEIYSEDKVLSKDEIIRNKIATQTSSWAS